VTDPGPRVLDCTAMDWSTALSTLLGAVVGVGSALLVDRVKWGREQAQRWQQTRREAFVAYLTALHRANEAMRAVSLGERPDGTTMELAARAAFRAGGVYETREQVILVASEPVVRTAEVVFRRLRELRDLIGQGGRLGSEGYEPALVAYGDALQALRDAIRKDLGIEPLGVHPPL
jgi:hypothetical protein